MEWSSTLKIKAHSCWEAKADQCFSIGINSERAELKMVCRNGPPSHIVEGLLKICSGMAPYPSCFISVTSSLMNMISWLPSALQWAR